MNLDLAGKRVVVTGADRGIGLAVVRGFVAGTPHVTPELENWTASRPSRRTCPRPAARPGCSPRPTHPDEVAALVLLSASGKAGNMTGAELTIDGGTITTL